MGVQGGAVVGIMGKLNFGCWEQKTESGDEGEWQGWRMSVELNKTGPWRTVPQRFCREVERYMMGGEYREDVEKIKEQILEYAKSIKIVEGNGGKDGWVMDVDDTCISNVGYYKEKGYGCEPFDSSKFKEWIMRAECEAIPSMLVVFQELVHRGFKVFLITGRDHSQMAHLTALNLHRQGFIGYHRLFLRSEEYKGQNAVKYKSEIRRQIEGEGYKIWGNVGDQWSDLQGYSLGNRNFKLPNPMYFIP